MIATTPTIQRIFNPILSALQEEVSRARKSYAQMWELVNQTWRAFDVAVDEGKPLAVRNDLAGHARLAEAMKHDAWVEMNNAEELLLSMWN